MNNQVYNLTAEGVQQTLIVNRETKAACAALSNLFTLAKEQGLDVTKIGVITGQLQKEIQQKAKSKKQTIRKKYDQLDEQLNNKLSIECFRFFVDWQQRNGDVSVRSNGKDLNFEYISFGDFRYCFFEIADGVITKHFVAETGRIEKETAPADKIIEEVKKEVKNVYSSFSSK